MTRHCTIPEILHLRGWFEDNYGHCCRVHDAGYKDMRYSRRICDIVLLECMLAKASTKAWYKKPVHYIFCWLTYVFVRLMGWLHYGEE